MSRRLRRQYAWAIHHPPSLKLRRDESSFAKANVAPQHWHEWWLFGSFPATGWKREWFPVNCRFLRACLQNQRGAVFKAKAGWQGATKENILHGSSTEEQRRQPAFASKTLRAAGLLALGFVVAGVAAHDGDAPPAPPRPKPKSLAAAPLSILRQAQEMGFVPAFRPRLAQGFPGRGNGGAARTGLPGPVARNWAM